MNSSGEQNLAVSRPHSAKTRQRLLEAAAALIAEVGWGRVTTRAVAQRAELPLGTVSYHFHGKQELLSQAALQTVDALLPMTELAAVDTLADLIGLVKVSVGNRDPSDRMLSGVLLETMREAGRDRALAERMTTLLAEYRRILCDLVRTEQRRGAVRADIDPAALATLLAAAGDGLLLHALLDPGLEVAGSIETLLTMVGNAEAAGASTHD